MKGIHIMANRIAAFLDSKPSSRCTVNGIIKNIADEVLKFEGMSNEELIEKYPDVFEEMDTASMSRGELMREIILCYHSLFKDIELAGS